MKTWQELTISERREESWSRKFEQLDEWIFCLKSATILPVIRSRDDQEITSQS